MINIKPKIYTVLVFSSALSLSLAATAQMSQTPTTASPNLSSGTPTGQTTGQISDQRNLSSGTQFGPFPSQQPVQQTDQRPLNFGVISDTGVNGQLRSMILNDSTLSTNAQNVNIINVNGVPTLTGSVATEDERERLGILAGTVVNAQTLQNRVEVRSR